MGRSATLLAYRGDSMGQCGRGGGRDAARRTLMAIPLSSFYWCAPFTPTVTPTPARNACSMTILFIQYSFSG